MIFLLSYSYYFFMVQCLFFFEIIESNQRGLIAEISSLSKPGGASQQTALLHDLYNSSYL